MQYDRPISREAQQLLSYCDDLAVGLQEGGIYEQLDQAGQRCYHAAHTLIASDNPDLRRAGFVMFFDALMEDPNTIIAAVDSLRARAAAVPLDPSDEARVRFGL